MKIKGIEATVTALRLRVPVHSSGLTHSDNTTLFLRVVTDGPSGWGECAARAGVRLPDPTVEAVEPSVVDRVVGRLFDACERGELPPAASVVEACLGVGSTAEQSVAAALEMAVLDAELLLTNRSLASFLGVVQREFETGAPGIADKRGLGGESPSALNLACRSWPATWAQAWDRRRG